MSYANDFVNSFASRLSSWGKFSPSLVKLLANCALAQAKHESANFTSNVFVTDNNPIGYKYYEGSLWQSGRGIKAPDGGYYAKFGSVQAAAYELADWINRRSGSFSGVQGTYDYALAMRNSSYYGASLSEYVAGLNRYYNAGAVYIPDQTAFPVGSYEDRPDGYSWPVGQIARALAIAVLLVLALVFGTGRR